jgi:hypothetical protein
MNILSPKTLPTKVKFKVFKNNLKLIVIPVSKLKKYKGEDYMNDIEKLLKDKLASQGIDKAWLDSHLEILTDDDDEEDS